MSANEIAEALTMMANTGSQGGNDGDVCNLNEPAHGFDDQHDFPGPMPFKKHPSSADDDDDLDINPPPGIERNSDLRRSSSSSHLDHPPPPPPQQQHLPTQENTINANNNCKAKFPSSATVAGRFSDEEKKILFSLIKNDSELRMAYTHQLTKRKWRSKSWMNEIAKRFNEKVTRKRKNDAVRHHLKLRKNRTGTGFNDASCLQFLLKHTISCFKKDTCSKCFQLARLRVKLGYAKCGHPTCVYCDANLPSVIDDYNPKELLALTDPSMGHELLQQQHQEEQQHQQQQQQLHQQQQGSMDKGGEMKNMAALCSNEMERRSMLFAEFLQSHQPDHLSNVLQYGGSNPEPVYSSFPSSNGLEVQPDHRFSPLAAQAKAIKFLQQQHHQEDERRDEEDLSNHHHHHHHHHHQFPDSHLFQVSPYPTSLIFPNQNYQPMNLKRELEGSRLEDTTEAEEDAAKKQKLLQVVQ